MRARKKRAERYLRRVAFVKRIFISNVALYCKGDPIYTDCDHEVRMEESYDGMYHSRFEVWTCGHCLVSFTLPASAGPQL